MIDFSSKMVVCVHSDYRILLKVQEERYFAKFRYGDKLYNNFDVPYRKRFNANACVRVCLPIPFDDPSMDQEEQEEEPKKRQNTRSSSGWYSISTRKIKQKKNKSKNSIYTKPLTIFIFLCYRSKTVFTDTFVRLRARRASIDFKEGTCKICKISEKASSKETEMRNSQGGLSKKTKMCNERGRWVQANSNQAKVDQGQAASQRKVNLQKLLPGRLDESRQRGERRKKSGQGLERVWYSQQDHLRQNAKTWIEDFEENERIGSTVDQNTRRRSEAELKPVIFPWNLFTLYFDEFIILEKSAVKWRSMSIVIWHWPSRMCHF